jgi:Tol biopolymer transport system component
VRRDGLVKIVDLGLTKLIDAARSGDTVESQTRATRAGATLGTLSYMSPEQALGQPLDARTDLFSLGVVLYEMVTGHLPFERTSDAATYDALLNKPVPPARHANPAVTPELDATITRALEKDRGLRYQAALDLEADLKRLHRLCERAETDSARSLTPDTSDAAESAPRTTRVTASRPGILLAAIALAAIVIGALWVSTWRPAHDGGLDPSRFAFVRVSQQSGEELFPSLAPGGDAVVYASAADGNWDIYLHRFGGDAVNLTADSIEDDVQPVYSPDGRRILFRSERDGGGLFIMGATGESVRRVTDFGWDPAWSPDGREIVCSMVRVEPTTMRLPPSELWIADVSSGRRRRLVDGPAYQPQWSPSSARIAFYGPDATGQLDLWTVSTTRGAPLRITDDRHLDWNPIWSVDGRSLYFLSDRDGTMNAWRVAIDEATGRALDVPRPFTLPSTSVLHLSRASARDAFAWSSQFGGAMIQRYELDPVGARIVSGPVSLTPRSRSLVQPEISPDGTLLAANTRGEAREDIVILRTDGTQMRALTEDQPRDRGPRWSPDGRRLAFSSDRSGGTEIFLINSDGSGLDQITTSSPPHGAKDVRREAPAGRGPCCPVWSPDGRRLAYLADDLSVRAIELSETGKDPRRDVLLVKPPVWFEPVSWSADGSRLAGQERRGNNPRGGVAVYDLGPKQYTLLTRSGGKPIWLHDNRRLVYSDTSSVYLLDTISRQTHKLLSIAPYQNSDVTITRDNRHLYVSVRAIEADVWVATPK